MSQAPPVLERPFEKMEVSIHDFILLYEGWLADEKQIGKDEGATVPSVSASSADRWKHILLPVQRNIKAALRAMLTCAEDCISVYEARYQPTEEQTHAVTPAMMRKLHRHLLQME